MSYLENTGHLFAYKHEPINHSINLTEWILILLQFVSKGKKYFYERYKDTKYEVNLYAPS